MELRLFIQSFLLLTVFGLAITGPASRYNSQYPQNDGSSLETTAATPEITEQQVLELLQEICSKIRDEIHPEIPSRFSELVHSLKRLSHAATARIHSKIQGLCPSSGKLHDIWSDALIMDSSEGSLKLLTEQIIRHEVSTTRANYLLTMIGFSHRPSLGSVRAVLPLLEQSEPQRQALLGSSALIRSHLNLHPENRDSREVKDAVRAILKHLEKNQATGKSQKIIESLKSLQNIGVISDEAVESILRIASDANQKTAVRVAALESIVTRSSETSVTRKCYEIFKNTQEESELRIAAYKICMEGADRQTVQNVISVLKHEQNKQGE